MGQALSAKESSQEQTEIGSCLKDLCTHIHLLPEAAYAFLGCPCRKAVGEPSSGALNADPHKDRWRKVGQQEAAWLGAWRKGRPRSLRAAVSARACVVLAPAPLYLTLASQVSWTVSAASTGATGVVNTFLQASAPAARAKLEDLCSKNPRVQLKVRSAPATVRLNDVAVYQSVLSLSHVVGGACAVFQEAVLGAELTVEFPGCSWGPGGGRSTLHDVIVRQQGGPAFQLPCTSEKVDVDAIQQAMMAWSSQVELEPGTWVAVQVDAVETVGQAQGGTQDVVRLPSPTDDVTLAEAFLLTLKDPSRFKQENQGAVLSGAEKELGAAASAEGSAGAAAIAGQVVVQGITDEDQLDFALCHSMVAELVMMTHHTRLLQETPERLPQGAQTEVEPHVQPADEDGATYEQQAQHDESQTIESQLQEEDEYDELFVEGMDEHDAAVKLQKIVKGKQTRVNMKPLLESRLANVASNKPPPAFGLFKPEGSSIGLVLDGQSHRVNSTRGGTSIAQLVFGRSARILYSVTPEFCDWVQHSFGCSTPLGPTALVALVPARVAIENMNELKEKALVWRRVDHTQPEGEAILPVTDVDLLHPGRSQERWELRLYAAEANLSASGVRCAQVGGGLRCQLDDMPTPETLRSVLDTALRKGSQPVLRRVTDQQMEAQEALVVRKGDFPRLMKVLSIQTGMPLCDLPPVAPATLEVVSISSLGPDGEASRVKLRVAQLQAYTIRVQVQSVQTSECYDSIKGSAHADFRAKIPFVCALDLPCGANAMFRCREVGPAGAGAWGEWTPPVR